MEKFLNFLSFMKLFFAPEDAGGGGGDGDTGGNEPPEPDHSTDDKTPDVDEMTKDDIMKADIKPDDPDKKEPDKKEPEKKEPEKKEPDEKDTKTPEKTEKDEKVAIEYDEDGKPVYYDKHGNKITGDPLKDTKSALTRAQTEIANLKKELQQLKESKEAERFEGFEVLTDEELATLREESPEEAEEYEKEYAEYQEFQQKREYNRLATQWNIILDATADLLEFHTGQRFDIDPSIPFQQQPAEVQKFIAEVIKEKIDPYITQNYQRTEDGLYTKDQILAAHRVLFHDDYINKAKSGLREQVLDDIKRANTGGSDLDRIPKTGGKDALKKASELTPEEIASMTEEEVDYYLQQVGNS